MRGGIVEHFPERVENHDDKLEGLLPCDVQPHGAPLLIDQLPQGHALQVLRAHLGLLPPQPLPDDGGGRSSTTEFEQKVISFKELALYLLINL